MSRYPIDAFPIEGDPFPLDGDLIDLFGVTDDGHLVTNASRSAPYDIWLSYGLLDALVHWRGRWFVGKLSTVGVGESKDLCPVGPFHEVTGNAAGKWLCSMERFGRIPEQARALFAKVRDGAMIDPAEPATVETIEPPIEASSATTSTTAKRRRTGRPPDLERLRAARELLERFDRRNKREHPTRAAYEEAIGLKRGAVKAAYDLASYHDKAGTE